MGTNYGIIAIYKQLVNLAIHAYVGCIHKNYTFSPVQICLMCKCINVGNIASYAHWAGVYLMITPSKIFCLSYTQELPFWFMEHGTFNVNASSVNTKKFTYLIWVSYMHGRQFFPFLINLWLPS